MFEWDPHKEAANIEKHNIGFSAVYDFDFGTTTEFNRTRELDGEERFALIGFLYGKLYTMIYTMRGKAIRVISLRRSNKKEENAYEKIRQKSAR